MVSANKNFRGNTVLYDKLFIQQATLKSLTMKLWTTVCFDVCVLLFQYLARCLSYHKLIVRSIKLDFEKVNRRILLRSIAQLSSGPTKFQFI
jgi:hypothetical protein